MFRGRYHTSALAPVGLALTAGMGIGWWLSPPSEPAASEWHPSGLDAAGRHDPAMAEPRATKSRPRFQPWESRVDLPIDLEQLAARSPLLAQRELKRIGNDPELLATAHAALAHGWATTAPVAAAAWVDSIADTEDRIAAAMGLIPAWASRDPQACMDWCLRHSKGSLRELSLVSLADAWVDLDPKAAFIEYSGLADEIGRERGLHAICSEWALDDPDNALRDLDTLASADRRDDLLETALVSLANQTPEQSWQKADMVPNRAHHIRAMALEAIAETHPQRAISLLGTVEAVPVEWWRAIARGWSFAEPEAAATWAKNLADPETRTAVLQEIGADP